jgi:hypothetical protein
MMNDYIELNLAAIMTRYRDRHQTTYGASTTPNQWSALNAILGCRSRQYGEVGLSCSACPWQIACPRSCGHRACNQCQHQTTEQWLARQERKLLPVNYFMVTFTLPRELRKLAKSHQNIIYPLLFKTAVATLKAFGLNEKNLNAELAMTAILHTHTRRLDYHPHVHIVVPGGGINTQRSEWRKVQGDYLFNSFKLATAFRGAMLNAIEQSGLWVPSTPKKWVVNCTKVGRGRPALQYLSRYLYRGVISNKNIIADDGYYVTFRYTDSKTHSTKTRRVLGEEFIKLILQHTLPKGFRRCRDYGFLHGNAKRILKIVQWALQIATPKEALIKRKKAICKKCHSPMNFTGFIPAQRKAKPG